MATLWQDVRYAFRMLRKAPGLTLIALGSLALGIGANSTIFSAINSMLFTELPYREPDRLVQVWESNVGRGWNQLSLSLPNAADYAASPVFERAAWYDWQAVNLTGDGEPERLAANGVSAGFFQVLGREAAVGRTLRLEEAGPGAPRVAVISHGLWQRRFGGDPDVAGRVVTVDGVATEIVGVMPKGFDLPSAGTAVWLPLTTPVDPTSRGSRYVQMVARLAPGITVPAALDALAGQARQLAEAHPESNQGFSATIESLKDHIYGPEFETASAILMVAVFSVLLVACANIANLLLARAVARSRESSLRTALGASRGRLVRQYLIESLMLALGGGVLGLLFTFWGTDALGQIIRRGVPRADQVRVDGDVLLYTLALSLLSGIIFGLVPAVRAAQAAPSEVLKESGRGNTGGRRQGRLRNALVVAEIAVALLLTMSAGLMVRSFIALRQIDPGYQAEGILTLNVALPEASYGNDSAIVNYAARVTAELRAIPGVEAAAPASILPASGNNSSSGFTIVGLPEPRPEDRPSANLRAVGPEYFTVLQVPIVSGTGLEGDHRMDGRRVVVVNQQLVNRYLPNRDPLGAELQFGDHAYTVIGVARDFRERDLDDPPVPMVFVPLSQWVQPGFELALRTSGDPAALATLAREAVRRVDPAIPVGTITTMDERISERRNGDWIITRLLLMLAGVALVLAAAGVFGVMSYSVSQRSGEIGVRLAIGANPRDIVALVLRQGARLAAVGLGLGLVLAVLGTQALRGFLAGVSPLDPWTYGAVTLLLGSAVLLACWLPARRAAGTDPIAALRVD